MEVAFLPGQDEDNDVDDGNEVVDGDVCVDVVGSDGGDYGVIKFVTFLNIAVVSSKKYQSISVQQRGTLKGNKSSVLAPKEMKRRKDYVYFVF